MLTIGTNYVFVHCPKNGGSSVSAALDGRQVTDYGHTPRFLAGHPDKIAFGFVRNPWDRMVSLWSFMCQKPASGDGEAKKIKLARDLGFKRWLMEYDFFLGQDHKWWSEDLPPMQRRSQMWWLDGGEHIGRFETMAEDIRNIAHEVRFDLRPLPRLNTSAHGDYRAHYDAGSAAFVAEHFAPEIKRFGYTF